MSSTQTTESPEPKMPCRECGGSGLSPANAGAMEGAEGPGQSASAFRFPAPISRYLRAWSSPYVPGQPAHGRS